MVLQLNLTIILNQKNVKPILDYTKNLEEIPNSW